MFLLLTLFIVSLCSKFIFMISTKEVSNKDTNYSPKISNNIFSVKMRKNCYYLPKIRYHNSKLNLTEYMQNTLKHLPEFLKNNEYGTKD